VGLPFEVGRTLFPLTVEARGGTLPPGTYHRIRVEPVSRRDAHPTTVPRATVTPLYLFLLQPFCLGGVASHRSFGSSREGAAAVPVHGLRSIGPSRLPGDPAQLGVPAHRTGLSVSRTVDPTARKVTKVAWSPDAPISLMTIAEILILRKRSASGRPSTS